MKNNNPYDLNSSNAGYRKICPHCEKPIYNNKSPYYTTGFADRCTCDS